MDTETITTSSGLNATVTVAVDYKSAAILGVVLFVGVLMALLIYKKL